VIVSKPWGLELEDEAPGAKLVYTQGQRHGGHWPPAGNSARSHHDGMPDPCREGPALRRALGPLWHGDGWREGGGGRGTVRPR